MAKIHTLRIKNFRGIQSFNQVFGEDNFVCLIGRGDSGKSTLLEAISLVLSTSYNISFYDSDFYNCDTDNSIEIEATLTNLPEHLLKENKFGLFIRGVDTSTNEIHDEIEDHHEKAITIRLEVKKDLEPIWNVVNNRQSPAYISGNDRSRLNVFMVSDYVDRHFSWSKGNPLSSLLRQDSDADEANNLNIIIEALREAKTKIDTSSFSHFDKVLAKVKDSASSFGVDISNALTTIDFKDLSIKDGRVCLHEENIPFRMKGKGSKRLISMAIQATLAEFGGIVLIDEVEQGLEPDRAQHLVSTLKKKNKGQVFLTTHSRDVLVELETRELFLLKKNYRELTRFDPSLQNCLRSNPEAFFAKKIIVCEGQTEIGISRALNSYRIGQGKKSAALNGISFANGTGSGMIHYVLGFHKSKFPVSLFCDSDVPYTNNQKKEIRALGVEIFDWDEGDCLEVAVIKYLSFAAVQELLRKVVEFRLLEQPNQKRNEVGSSIWQSVSTKFGDGCPGSFLTEKDDSPQMRLAIGTVAADKNWFKNISKGEVLGNVIFKDLEAAGHERLKIQFESLSKWMDK